MREDIGLPSIRTAFISISALSDIADALNCKDQPEEVITHLLRSDFSIQNKDHGNTLTVSSDHAESATAQIALLQGQDRLSLVMSGDEHLVDSLAKRIAAISEHDEKPLTLLTQTAPDIEHHSNIIDVFKSLLPAIEAELTPYLSKDAYPTKVTVTFADSGYLVDRFLDSEVLGCFFVLSENDREDAILSDHGFEVILNVGLIADELMDADSERYLSSIISTLPHEIVHALNFANAGRGLTPTEAYDCGLLYRIQDYYIETTFGSQEREEQFTEMSGLLIADRLCTPDIIRQMALASASHDPAIRALCAAQSPSP